MTGGWDELREGHPSLWVDRDAWAPELDRAAARRLEADALAAEVAERARTVRFWVGFAVGLVATGVLLAWSLRTGG